MKCPYCNKPDTKVIDSRPTEDGHAIRRRRGCDFCNKRFTTYEKVEDRILVVVKRNGTSREQFDRAKVLSGIVKACEKRPVSMTAMEEITSNVEKKLYNDIDSEVTSSYIGELVMDELRRVDEVAYVRFASVYRQFKDVDTFIEEIAKLVGKRGEDTD